MTATEKRATTPASIAYRVDRLTGLTERSVIVKMRSRISSSINSSSLCSQALLHRASPSSPLVYREQKKVIACTGFFCLLAGFTGAT